MGRRSKDAVVEFYSISGGWPVLGGWGRVFETPASGQSGGWHSRVPCPRLCVGMDRSVDGKPLHSRRELSIHFLAWPSTARGVSGITIRAMLIH